MLAGLGAFIGLFIVISIAILGFAESRDGFNSEDIGDPLEKANAVAVYADERLAAAANGEALPAPPDILANQEDLQFVLVMSLVSQAFLAVLVVLIAGQGLRGFIRQTGLDEIRFGRLWLICGCVVLAYLGTFLYSLAAAATGIEWLEPTSTLPTAVVRDNTTLWITGVVTLIGAPISEELFFRGLTFSGLLRWGFWPAASGAGLMFSAVHFDPGSLIPFFAIGVLICWIYYRRKSLWDAVLFHFIFNATSFAILVATS